ncbi:MAG: hypothetical protein ACTHK3_00575 [Solirubrobacterales bacterium]
MRFCHHEFAFEERVGGTEERAAFLFDHSVEFEHGFRCPACEEQIAGSAFLTELNSGGDTLPGVEYTVIQTRYDQVVTPYTSAFLSGADNILLQNECILDLGDHLSMPYDHIADADVLTALDPTHPRHPLCTPILPTSGG